MNTFLQPQPPRLFLAETLSREIRHLVPLLSLVFPGEGWQLGGGGVGDRIFGSLPLKLLVGGMARPQEGTL